MPKRTRRSSDRTIAPSSGTPWASPGSCETGRPAAGDRWHSLPRPCDPSVGGTSKRNHRVRFAGHGAVRPLLLFRTIWAERFWATLQAEVLDRQHLEDPRGADAAVTAYASYYNYHRLRGELGWRTTAERFDGTPFLDRGFEHVASLAAVAPLLAELLSA